MTNNKIIRIHRIYNILLSISIFVAGICLMAGCLSIYSLGDQPYSREIVIETFSKISIPVYICLALTIGGFIKELSIPSQSEKEKKFKPYGHTLDKLISKKDLSKCEKDTLKAIQKEQKLRKTLTLTRTIIIFISSIVFLAYALNGNNYYQSNINDSVIRAMYVLVPCLIIPFIFGVFTAYRNEKSLKTEIELIKKAPTKENAEAEEISAVNSDKKTSIIKIAILFAGIGFLLYGYFAGGTADVLTKAINICTECIGLG